MIKPLIRIAERIAISKDNGDTDYFLDLLYSGEQLTKLVTAGLLACIADDSDRHRYTQQYRLVRADGIGEWSKVIDELLIGPTSQFFNPVANNLQNELTTRYGRGNWQYDSVELLYRCLKKIEPGFEPLSTKLSGRAWFNYFATIRNKTRGHGAPTTSVTSSLCEELNKSIDLFIQNYSLFSSTEWAYLHRNLSGKYKVSDISTTASRFHYLKTDRNVKFENGTYMYLNKPTAVDFVLTDADLRDFYFPNGGFNQKRYEVLSYVTGSKDYADASAYLIPPGELPASETEGLGKLELVDRVFTNLPTVQQIYIKRRELEDELKKILINDRHPVVTLTGRGGIGKTTLAISVLKQLCSETRFTSIIWFSARDIDLLPEGAKPVKPHVLGEEDISKELAKLIEPLGFQEKSFRPRLFMESELTKSSIGPTLYIFDNFETVKSPIDLYQWLDTYIRVPNKVLITSRFREFKGDYPIEVGGMNYQEFSELVDRCADSLEIQDLVQSQEYREELYTESDGHPYVVKVILGEVAMEKATRKVKRVIAGNEDILTPLFERSFNGLTPASKRVLLTLCNWRSTIPQIALEAVLLREQNEAMDVKKAVEELHRSSLIEIAKSNKDEMLFLTVPYSASVFGKRKLQVSPMKTAIEADTKLLHIFGVGLSSEIHLGVEPRIIKFFRDIAKRVSLGLDKIENYTHILEFLCRSYPECWLTLSSLYEEENKIRLAVAAQQHYLEHTQDVYQQSKGWNKLSQLYALSGDWNGQVHALIEVCELPITSLETVVACVTKILKILQSHKLTSEAEMEILIKKLIFIFKSKLELASTEAKGSDYSALAWLYLHLNNKKDAKDAILKGLHADPNNYHCLKLKSTLKIK
jgi:hypothetical protein